jgi:hypothetical protein
MSDFYIIIISLLFVLLFLYLFTSDKPYVGKSNIQGKGLFAGKNYIKGDTIIVNLFPHKEEHIELYDVIPNNKFYDYILYEGRYINHCSTNKNVDVVSKDHKIFSLIAIKDINKHDEIYSDYKNVNKQFPFIRSVAHDFVDC